MQAQRLGFFDKVASSFVRKAVLWSFLGTGAAGYVAKSHFDGEIKDAQIQGQVLDLKFHDLTGRREQEQKLNAALTQQKQELLAFRSQSDTERIELQKELAGLQQANQKLTSELQETQGSLTQARAENGNLNGRIGTVETTLASESTRINDAETKLASISDLKEQIVKLKEIQDKTITEDVILSIIEKSKPSFVTISEKANPIAHGSGFITEDVDGNYYVATCGHMAKNYEDLFKEFIIEGFNGAFKFDLTPAPLPDGTVAWHSFKMGDFSLWPLDATQLKTIQDGVNKKFGSQAKVGLKFRAYNKSLKQGETGIGLGSPAILQDSVKVTTVGRTGIKKQFNGALKEQEMFEIGHGTTPGESGGPLIGINRETMEPEIVGLNTVTMQFNRSIGGGLTHQHMMRLAAQDGVYFDSDPTNACTILMDAHDAGLKKGLSKDLVEKARANAKKAFVTPAGVVALIFNISAGGEKINVDDTNAEFYAADMFTPSDGKMFADLSIPLLPIPPPPLPEDPFLPSPDLILPPLPAPVIPDRKLKPAPIPPILEEAPPPPPEEEILPSKPENRDDVAPPPPVK